MKKSRSAPKCHGSLTLLFAGFSDRIPRETREGWPLLTVETEKNGESWEYRYKWKGSFFHWFIVLVVPVHFFLSCLGYHPPFQLIHVNIFDDDQGCGSSSLKCLPGSRFSLKCGSITSFLPQCGSGSEFCFSSKWWESANTCQWTLQSSILEPAGFHY